MYEIFIHIWRRLMVNVVELHISHMEYLGMIFSGPMDPTWISMVLRTPGLFDPYISRWFTSHN